MYAEKTRLCDAWDKACRTVPLAAVAVIVVAPDATPSAPTAFFAVVTVVPDQTALVKSRLCKAKLVAAGSTNNAGHPAVPPLV
jgi:hypothetical protein